MQNALNSVGSAMNNSDIAAMQAACRQLSDASANFAATLPSPNQTLTSEARAAVGAVSALSSSCLAESPDLSAVSASANQVADHLNTVLSISNGD
jgi:outer membrane lipoprotein-sorting protein